MKTYHCVAAAEYANGIQATTQNDMGTKLLGHTVFVLTGLTVRVTVHIQLHHE